MDLEALGQEVQDKDLPLHKQRIANIGAGTAGLASAILLARQGHDVTLFGGTVEAPTLGGYQR